MKHASRVVAAWGLLLVLAIANGAVRELWLGPTLGPQGAHVISTLMLAGFILAVTCGLASWLQLTTGPRAGWVGLAWCAGTVAFEFLAGHYLFGSSWAQLREAYAVSSGRVWVLVPLTLLGSPWIAYRAGRS